MAIHAGASRAHALPAREALERDLLASSLALLESGDARRVTVVGVRFGGLVAELRPEADAHGLSLRALPRRDRRDRLDVVVEPVG